MLELLTLFAIVLGVNLLPAFGPPTWAILVLYVLSTDIHPALLIPVAATAAASGPPPPPPPLPPLPTPPPPPFPLPAPAPGPASGRLLLALAFRLLGNRLPRKYRDNLAAARAALEKNPPNPILPFRLSSLSPPP